MTLVPASSATIALSSPAATARHMSNISDEIPKSVVSPDLLTKIPDAPPIPAATNIFGDAAPSTVQEAIVAGAEPTFASIGLGGWSPVGIVQNCMESMHIGCDIPWWGAIIIGTIVVRTIIFPLVIMAQRNAAKMNNNLPGMQVLQMKMTEARQSGNALESARYAQEMVKFMREKDMNPLKNMLVPLAQAPLFISFFIGLRQMANAPVESLRDGGLFWFTDLTMSDPYFLLPLITSATLYLTIELGTDSAKLSAQNMQTMKYVLRAMPIIIFPFTMNFPSLILGYWACSNFISLVQVGVLRIPAVRDFFRIERSIVHTADTLPIKKKPFVQGVKDCKWACVCVWMNAMKISCYFLSLHSMDKYENHTRISGAGANR